MRLLIDVSAIPARPVGAGVYAISLVAALERLAPADVEVHLLTRSEDGSRWQQLAPSATCHPVVPLARPARLVWEQTRAAGMAERLDIDVWHGPHYTLPLRLRCPAVVTIHDLTFFDQPQWHERTKVAYFRPMIRAASRRAEVLVAVSPTTARRIGEVLAPEAQVITIAHGVDHARFRPEPGLADELTALRRLGVEPPYVAFVGTMEPRKGVPVLVEAFARLAARHPHLRLVLAGRDGWGTESVRAAVAASGFATRIQRLRWVPDDVLPMLYRWADAVAYPSYEEGFGLPALEALASGAALITTSGTPMADFAAGAALTVAPGDPDALADALQRLLTDRDLAGRLRAAGPGVASGCTWEASARRHLWAYRLAAESNGVRIVGAPSQSSGVSTG